MKLLLFFLVIVSLGYYLALMTENRKKTVTIEIFGQHLELSLGVLIGVNLLDGMLLYYIISEILL